MQIWRIPPQKQPASSESHSTCQCSGQAGDWYQGRESVTFSLEINCLYLDAIVKLQFQYYSLFAAPLASRNSLLKSWRTSNSSFFCVSGLSRPNPQAIWLDLPSHANLAHIDIWDLINCAISRLSCSQNSWSKKKYPDELAFFSKCVFFEPQCI